MELKTVNIYEEPVFVGVSCAVVDYVGIASALKQAMNDYTRRDQKNYGNMDVAKAAYPKFLEKLSICRDFMHGFDYQIFITGSDLDKAKITPQELLDYIGLGNDGYALHLSNVKVFDEPLSLNECENYFCEELKQAPQNMMNVKLGLGNYVLISIQPQHLAKILNGEKTIEVRKKVLNSLKEVL